MRKIDTLLALDLAGVIISSAAVCYGYSSELHKLGYASSLFLGWFLCNLFDDGKLKELEERVTNMERLR